MHAQQATRQAALDLSTTALFQPLRATFDNYIHWGLTCGCRVRMLYVCMYIRGCAHVLAGGPPVDPSGGQQVRPHHHGSACQDVPGGAFDQRFLSFRVSWASYPPGNSRVWGPLEGVQRVSWASYPPGNSRVWRPFEGGPGAYPPPLAIFCCLPSCRYFTSEDDCNIEVTLTTLPDVQPDPCSVLIVSFQAVYAFT